MKEYIGEREYLFVGRAWELRKLVEERKEVLKP
jgi:hypothetical protein